VREVGPLWVGRSGVRCKRTDVSRTTAPSNVAALLSRPLYPHVHLPRPPPSLGADQLAVHGVGDCGVILLRDTRLDRVGTLLRGGTQAGIAPGWRVSARATQQLKGFNQPFQLGFAPGQEARFEAPWHGETLVLPVQEGDIVIAASDG
jgi:hypothetical protein